MWTFFQRSYLYKHKKYFIIGPLAIDFRATTRHIDTSIVLFTLYSYFSVEDCCVDIFSALISLQVQKVFYKRPPCY